MIKIITAIGEEKINEELKKINDLKIINKDIQYLEGIFEVLEINKDIDYIIIGDKIVDNNYIIKTINNIKRINEKIEIILITKFIDEEIKKYLDNKNIKYLIDEKINIKKIINLFKIKNKKNINYLNYKIENNKNLINEESDKYKINKNNLIENNINDSCKIISVAGVGGVGKSIFTAVLAKQLQNKFNKILIIDLDILNNSMNTIFGVNKYPIKIRKKIKNLKENNNIKIEKDNIKKLVIKINNNIELLSGNNLLFNFDKFDKENFEKIINNLKQEYDLILVDTSSECFFDNNKYIMNISNYIFFLVEGNLVQVQKSNYLLDTYLNKWKLNKEKIKIIINKDNKNAIDINILRKIFSNFNIIGKLNLDEVYIYLINHACDFNNSIEKKINKEYEKLDLEILKNN